MHVTPIDPLLFGKHSDEVVEKEEVGDEMKKMNTPNNESKNSEKEYTKAGNTSNGLSKEKKGMNLKDLNQENETKNSNQVVKSSKAKNETRPNFKKRFDQHNHFPVLSQKPTRCKNEDCKKITHTHCSKCKVHLCLVKNRNCFLDYHNLIDDMKEKSRKATKKKVKPSVRFDLNNHIPIFCSKMNRCKNEKCNKKTLIHCFKCEANLCIVKNRNCFLEYHSL